ncbi:MAG: DUF2848 family protein [Desulforhopalus sp.]
MENIIPIAIERVDKKTQHIDFSVKRLFNAGWAGRDRAAVQHHIDELAAIGVPPPKHVPTLFALGNHMLTCQQTIQVHGEETSGEIEYVLFRHGGETFITVGSDHTDRRLEIHSIPKSKNLCLNVMASTAWPYNEVKDHFDQLILDCTVSRENFERPYQKDAVSALLDPAYWLELLEERLGDLHDGLVFFSGTIGTVEGLVVGDGYTFSLTDPVLNRTISHSYSCELLTGAIEDY